MPHFKFKYIPIGLTSGKTRCSCGQTFDYESDRDFKMKVQMHKKLCDKWTSKGKVIRQPWKAAMLKEAQPEILHPRKYSGEDQ